MNDEQAMANIAANLRIMRNGRSLYAVAKAAGTYPINIARIEAGLHMPGAGLLSRIAEALGTSVDRMLASPEKNSENAS